MERYLTHDFFNQPTLNVAKSLIGCTLHFHGFSGITTETEAYIGQDDPACHASKGCTPRTQVMFGPAGNTYVYLIYGMYHCLNIVTEPEGSPAAVLIRGIFCLNTHIHLTGPGKLCKAWHITKAHNHLNAMNPPHIYMTSGIIPQHITQTPRIGIKVGLDKPWRFVLSSQEILQLSKQPQL